MWAKKPIYEWLIGSADFVDMILLVVVFVLPSPNSFLRFCLSTFFAADLKKNSTFNDFCIICISKV